MTRSSDSVPANDPLRLATQPGPAIPFGKYELVRLLAVGGMAEIFLARSQLQGITRPCVIKRILPKFSTDRQFVSMFIDEARITIGLEHKNIVRLFDFGQVDGAYFMAIEFVEGCDLVDVLKEHKAKGAGIEPRAAAFVARSMLAGLHTAHEQRDPRGNAMGIVHRDVSPQNVFLGWDGSVKVGDFGIASARNKLTRTVPGTVKGKFGYMSPEQALGGAIDRRADVWAVGVVLWEMIVGARLFGGDNVVASLARICDGTLPTPSERRPGAPKEIDRIVMRALTRPLADRYANADQMALELESFLGEHPFGEGELATYLADLDLQEKGVGRTLDQGEKSSSGFRIARPSAAGSKQTEVLADPVIRQLADDLKKNQNLWSLVDIGERHKGLGQKNEALSALRTAAAVFAHRGLVVQAICAINGVKPLVSPDELKADLTAIAALRAHSRKRLLDRIGRVDVAGFFSLVQEADPAGLGSHRGGDDTNLREPAPLFGRLAPNDFVALASVTKVERFAAGAIVVREGEVGSSLYAVGRGRLVVHCLPGSSDGGFVIPGEDEEQSAPVEIRPRTLHDGEGARDDRIYLSALADGDFFGELSFLTGRPRSATVEAISPCVLLNIDQPTVDAILKQDPMFSEPLLELYKERVAELMMAKNPVFSLLPLEERRELLKMGKLVRFTDDELIVSEGEKAETLFFIKHGEVEVFRTQEGVPVFINKLKEGQFFGEMAALMGTPRTASVRAMGEVEAFRIAANDLETILQKAQGVRELLERAMQSRALETAERIAEHVRVFEGV